MPGLLGAGRGLRPLRRAHDRAPREGDHFVVNGQKVWSSFAHIADWCILVTRSDPDSERHAGLTYLLVDMHAPGVEVRPLRQITGEAEFNEIFFTDVKVPVENVVGEIGGGWQVAMTTLLHERGTLGFALTAGAREPDPEADRAREGEGRDRGAARRDRARVDRPAGGPLHELPLADDADEDRDPRARGLGREALVVGGEPAGDEARARAARPGGAAADATGTGSPATGSTSSCARAATRSRPAPPRSCATSSPSACSASRGRADGVRVHARSRRSCAARRARSSRRTRTRRSRSCASSAGSASRSRRSAAAAGSRSSTRRSCSRRPAARSTPARS